MKINNLKCSIWQFIFSLIFTILTLIGTIICFKENDLLFAIIYLLVFIIAVGIAYKKRDPSKPPKGILLVAETLVNR